jgi:hypothetical protein
MQHDGAMEVDPLEDIMQSLPPGTVSPQSPYRNGMNRKGADLRSRQIMEAEMEEPDKVIAKRLSMPEHTASPWRGNSAGQVCGPGAAQSIQKIPGNVEPEQHLLWQGQLQAKDLGGTQSQDMTNGTKGDGSSSRRIAVDDPVHNLQRTNLMEIDPEQGHRRRSSRAHEKQSAKSYLAWLHHRQTRFPTAAPNSAECILIAAKLEMPAAQVYEDVLFRWGFETDSKFGAWHRQNRWKVLGEDPRFDEEVMGKWEAWLKQGRALM